MNLLQQLGLGRIAVGAAAFLAPGLTGQLGVGGPPEAHLAARLFGARDFALGVGTLVYSGEAQVSIVRLGALCDALDLTAAVIGARQGTLPKARAGLLGTIAAGAVLVGLTQARS